jgi:hypothetical protein
MSREEFFQFLKTTGGLVYPNGDLPHPISIFGVECDDGWLELIAELIRELVDAGWTREIRQIKEKFGGLRFYADGLSEKRVEIIMKYEKRSYEICEICGSTDKVRLCGYRWVKTLCDQCAWPWLERQYLVRLRCVHRHEP